MVIRLSASVFAAALIAAPAVADETKTSGDSTAKPEKITDKKHPDYVRCRTESIIGSRAKKRKVCLTNRQWAEVEHEGGRTARRIVESGRAGMRLD